MKKIVCLLILSFLFCCPSIVFAESKLNIDCSDSATAGKDLICILKTAVDEGVTYNKIESSISLADAKITFEWESGFSGNLNNNTLIVNSSSEVGNATVGKMKVNFPVSTSGTKNIVLANVKLYKDSELISSLGNATDSVVVKSDVKTLDELSIENCNECKLSPKFSSNITIYTLKTTADKINIVASPSGNATVSGTGEKTLTKDKETFDVVVTSEAGNKTTYSIIVTKVYVASSDSTLKNLSIEGGVLEPEFSSDVTSYKLTLDKEEVVINAEASNAKAKVTGTGKQPLNYGNNEFTILVTAEDGSTKSYLININKPETRNSNAYLKELTINGEKINFEKDILEYTYTVGNSVTELNIVATPELETSKVTITGGKDLAVGKNEVIILVTAEDESTKEYKLIVTRDEIDRSELYLESLEVKDYVIDFAKDKYEYSIQINGEESLDVFALAEDQENHTVEISGNNNLKDGSIIKVIISDSEGNSNIYKIKINIPSNSDVVEDKVNDDINYIPYIMTGLLIVLAVTDLILLIKMIRKK